MKTSASSKATKSAKPAKNYSCPFPFSKVYQFKVTLLNTAPLVWRRIQVPGCYSFWDLHCAITDAFGWLDYHMHLFTVHNPKTGEKDLFGIPDEFASEDDVAGSIGPSWKSNVSRYFRKDNAIADYLYDFGDDWHHSVLLEAIQPKEKELAYPRCIGGENACPPEDCGGPSGYHRFKRAIAYHNAEDHDALLSWAGGWFDPLWFDMGLIRFEDPRLRWEIAFQDKPLPRHIRQVQYHRMNRMNRMKSVSRMKHE